MLPRFVRKYAPTLYFSEGAWGGGNPRHNHHFGPAGDRAIRRLIPEEKCSETFFLLLSRYDALARSGTE